MRLLAPCSAALAVATILLATPAGADPYIEISSHTSAVVTRLGLHAGHGYLTIDARTVDSAAAVTAVLPGGGGQWAIGPSPCSGSAAPDGTTTVRCSVPRAGNYVWTVPVTRTAGAVTGLIGTVGVDYPSVPNPYDGSFGSFARGSFAVTAALTSPALDTFPIVNLDAPAGQPGRGPGRRDLGRGSVDRDAFLVGAQRARERRSRGNH